VQEDEMPGSVRVPPALSNTARVALIKGARTALTATDVVSLFIAEETA
jgi:hypothetical protein